MYCTKIEQGTDQGQKIGAMCYFRKVRDLYKYRMDGDKVYQFVEMTSR